MLSLDFGICDQGITKTGVVSETATALTANEVTNAFKEGQGRIGGFAAKDFPDGDGECVQLSNPKKKKPTDVPDVFDELWDVAFMETKDIRAPGKNTTGTGDPESEGGEKGTGAPKKRASKGGTGNASKAPKVGGGASASDSKQPAEIRKLQSQIDFCEQAHLASEQLIRKCTQTSVKDTD